MSSSSSDDYPRKRRSKKHKGTRLTNTKPGEGASLWQRIAYQLEGKARAKDKKGLIAAIIRDGDRAEEKNVSNEPTIENEYWEKPSYKFDELDMNALGPDEQNKWLAWRRFRLSVSAFENANSKLAQIIMERVGQNVKDLIISNVKDPIDGHSMYKLLKQTYATATGSTKRSLRLALEAVKFDGKAADVQALLNKVGELRRELNGLGRPPKADKIIGAAAKGQKALTEVSGWMQKVITTGGTLARNLDEIGTTIGVL